MKYTLQELMNMKGTSEPVRHALQAMSDEIEALRQTRAAYQDKLDALGIAIVNAGYTWTTEMREAYEMPPNAWANRRRKASG